MLFGTPMMTWPPDDPPDWESLPPMPVSRASKRQPILVGHRGARGLAPENTLAGFQVAADLGIDGVEFDVQRTKDGHLIVFHDEDVSRTTGGQGMIGDLRLEEIKALDAGSSLGPEFRGACVPTLREAFEFLRQTDLLLFLELKSPWWYPGIEGGVVALIREYKLVERCQIRSFYHRALYEVYKLAPEIPLSSLWYDRLPTADDVKLKTINVRYVLCTPESIADIHQQGQQVEVWTVNELDVAREFIAAGIDSLATDYPDRLLKLFESET